MSNKATTYFSFNYMSSVIFHVIFHVLSNSHAFSNAQVSSLKDFSIYWK